MKNYTSVPDIIPPSLEREHRGCRRLVGPLGFVEIVEDIHREPDGLVVFSRKENDRLRSLGGCTVAKLRQVQQTVFDLLRTDGFMTINTVFLADGKTIAPRSETVSALRQCRRREKDLRWLNSAYVDIDCGKFGADPQQVLSEALDLLRVQCLPIPHTSLLVERGCGCSGNSLNLCVPGPKNANC